MFYSKLFKNSKENSYVNICPAGKTMTVTPKTE